MESAVWTIPAERMKAAVEHTVPLSSRALEILEEARSLSDGSGLVFPSSKGRVLSDNTLSKSLRELNIECVVHGFRTSFRNWCGDTGKAHDLAEAALAHTIRNKVEAAYNRTSLLERRRVLMQQWDDYLNAESGKVVQFRS